MKTTCTYLYAIVMLWLCNACAVFEKLPNVQFRGPTLEGVQAAADLQQVKIDLGLRFLFTNPYKKPIIVPEHVFVLKLNGQALPGQLQRQQSFEVPAEGARLVNYTYSFDLSPAGVLNSLNVLGKDNLLEFKAEVDIDLKDLGLKIPTALGKIPLRKHKLEFTYSDTIRLPLLPVIEPAGSPGRIRFLGQMEHFDLEPVKNAMTPFVDLLLDARFNSNLTDPFVNLLLLTNVDVPDPTPTQPLRTKKINLGDHMVQQFLAPVNPQFPLLWQSFKEKMSPGNVNIMDHSIQLFLEPLNTQAPAYWNGFKEQWAQFKAQPLTFQFPGPRVTGLEVEIPFRIYNPNAFSIHSPAIFGAADEGARRPFSFRAAPLQGSQVVPANARRDMRVLFTLDWGQLGQGLTGLMQGHTFQPRLSGRTSIDLGYGLMNLEIDLPLSLQGLIQQ